jgi:hypothetical protein
VQEFVKWKIKLRARYCEVYISAYQPEHQQIFYDAGLLPRGYIPSWKFNTKHSVFEDFILFNWHQGQISDEIQLIQEGWDLVKIFQFGCLTNNKIVKKTSNKKKIRELKNISSRVLFSPNILKSFLISGLLIFLTLIGISILVAQLVGDFSLIVYTISSLGSIRFTPFPYLFDMACMIGGFTTILFNILLFDQIYSYFIYSQKMFSVFKTGIITGFIGSVAIIMMGVFSLDRAGPKGLIHGIFAIIAFAGYVVSILIFSYYLIFCSHEISNFFGCTGLVGPLFASFLNWLFITPISEWLLLFSILIALIPQFLIIKNAF